MGFFLGINGYIVVTIEAIINYIFDLESNFNNLIH
jgi:hypothetical protein